jgi:hypothetical protein
MTRRVSRPSSSRGAEWHGRIAGKRREERAKRELCVTDLAERVMVAIGQRDAAIAEGERRVGEALAGLTASEGLSLSRPSSGAGRR